MGIAFDSEEAREVNKKIFETIYYASLESSMELSKERESKIIELKEITNKLENFEFEVESEKECIIKRKEEIENEIFVIKEELDRETYLGSYSSFIGSPTYEGKLQFDLWDIKPSTELKWDKLKSQIKRYGLRNSLLVALMPTASTSQILGNNECFEPYTNNIYNRRTMAGDFRIINKHLVYDLELIKL